MAKSKPLKVSFYSYKGGSGRSTTCWNTVERLLQEVTPTREHPFVIIDTDIESRGSTVLYGAEEDFFGCNTYQSIQSRIKNGVNVTGTDDESRKRNFFDAMCPIGRKFGEDVDAYAVLLLGVDSDRNENIITKGEANAEQMGNFKDFVKLCEKYGAKGIFFDTPSGTQGWARQSLTHSTIVICCMRPTSQFQLTTKKALKDFVDKDKAQGDNKYYILTPTTVCVDRPQSFVVKNNEEEFPEYAHGLIMQDFRNEKYKAMVKLDMLEPTPEKSKVYKDNKDDGAHVFGIPEIKRFKWFEQSLGCLPKDKGFSSNDEMGLNRYQYLADTIMKYYSIIISEEE